jgi:hypothetical protein
MSHSKKGIDPFPNNHHKRIPDEAIIPHPLYPGRDIKGRTIDGSLALPAKVMELKAAIYEAVSPEQIQEVITELRKLCLPGEHGPAIQLNAMNLFFDRVIGKASQEVLVHKTQTNTVKVDFAKLPTARLQELHAILPGAVIAG